MATATKRFEGYTAYSYRRYSSPGQRWGDVERQIREAREVAVDLGAAFDPNLVIDDSAVSSWKAKNLDPNEGNLGAFIEMAKAARIPKKTLLIVEHLDRFSRAGVGTALPIFFDLLKTGVVVHSCIDGITYTKQDIEDSLKVVGMVMYFAAANDFSNKLSKRVRESFDEEETKFNDGLPAFHPSMPSWMSWDQKTRTYTEHKDRIGTVKRIFRRYLSGQSTYRITRELMADKIPTLTGKNRWSPGAVFNLLRLEIVTGCVNGKRYPHWPVVVSKEDFSKVQSMLAVNKNKKGRSSTEHVNFLKGLMFCSCKSALSMSKTTSKQSNGVKGTYYLRCINRACDCRQVNSNKFEYALLARLGKDPESMVSDNTAAERRQLLALETEEQSLTRHIEKLSKANEDLDLDELVAQLTPKKAKREQVRTLIEETKGRLAMSSNPVEAITEIKSLLFKDGKDTVAKTYDKFLAEVQAVVADNSKRQKLALMVPQLVSRIDVDSTKDRLTNQTYTVTLRNGKVLHGELF